MPNPILTPDQSDYPAEMFDTSLSPEMRVGCAFAYLQSPGIVRRLFHQRLKVAFQLAGSQKFGRSLDAGTGVGYILPQLCAISKEVVGSDLSRVVTFTQSMLRKRGLRNASLIRSDILRLPLESGSFDAVFCMSVIEHIPEPRVAFAELNRVLGRGGVLIVGYPIEHALFRFLEGLLGSYARLRRGEFFRKEQEWWHPHMGDPQLIERGWQGLFEPGGRQDIRLVGIPVYRLLCLRKSG
jgi:SAM-dependent methyltransferase